MKELNDMTYNELEQERLRIIKLKEAAASSPQLNTANTAIQDQKVTEVAPDGGGDKKMTEDKKVEEAKGRHEEEEKKPTDELEAFRKVVSELGAWKTKKEEEEKARYEEIKKVMQEQVKAVEAKLTEFVQMKAFEEFKTKLAETEKVRESKLKEALANSNAGTILANIEQAMKGAAPVGFQVTEPSDPNAPRNFGDSMDRASKRRK